jgi:serine/threonine protein kinase
MLGGFFPFLSQPPTREGIIELIVRGRLDLNGANFVNVSRLGRDLLFRMLQVSEPQRITMEQIVHHPWFTRIYYL